MYVPSPDFAHRVGWGEQRPVLFGEVSDERVTDELIPSNLLVSDALVDSPNEPLP
jgi:hypothetical protein